MMALKPIRLQRQSASQLAASRKGSILMVTLWSLFLLVVFAIQLGYGVRQKLILIHRLEERNKLHYIAEAGVKQAIFELGKAAQGDYDSFSDTWSNDIGVFKERRLGGGQFTVSYAHIDEKTGLVYTRYGVVDEQRKININRVDQNVLRQLLRIVLSYGKEEAQELAASIIDWRDKDSELSIPIGSAEDFDYQALRYSYEAKDSEFEVLEELLLVRGIDEDIFNKIGDYITIYGDGKININTASEAVLLALGLSQGLVDKIIAFRYGENGILGNADDKVFVLATTIIPELSQYRSLSESELAELSRVVERNLVVKSNNFKIRSKSELNNKKETAEIICVIDRTGKILYWHES